MQGRLVAACIALAFLGGCLQAWPQAPQTSAPQTSAEPQAPLVDLFHPTPTWLSCLPANATANNAAPAAPGLVDLTAGVRTVVAAMGDDWPGAPAQANGSGFQQWATQGGTVYVTQDIEGEWQIGYRSASHGQFTLEAAAAMARTLGVTDPPSNRSGDPVDELVWDWPATSFIGSVSIYSPREGQQGGLFVHGLHQVAGGLQVVPAAQAEAAALVFARCFAAGLPRGDPGNATTEKATLDAWEGSLVYVVPFQAPSRSPVSPVQVERSFVIAPCPWPRVAVDAVTGEPLGIVPVGCD